MNIIVCLDDNGGMMFNHRRQSQDRILRERVIQLTAGRGLWMNSYSQKLFADSDAANIRASEKFLDDASSGDYCFVEDQSLLSYADRIERIVIYRWNRVYPHDMAFDLPLNGWALLSTEDFVGSSHDRITEEVYGR
jgi:hypothetical protein